MGRHKHSAVCPVCSGTLTADAAETLVHNLQRHAKDKHDIDLSTEKARMMVKSEA